MKQELQPKKSKPSKNAKQRKEKKGKGASKRVSKTPTRRADIDPMFEKIAHLLPPKQKQDSEEVFKKCMAILDTIKPDEFSKYDTEAIAPVQLANNNK